MRGRAFAGSLLVVIGVALLLIDLTGVGGVAVVLLGGIAFLATYVATRGYGFLVPGGILTGFGTALVLQDLGIATDIGLLGLGAGFLLIPTFQLLTGAVREGGWWWPFIPAGILVALGVIELTDGGAAGLVLPGALIILGLVFLLDAARRQAGAGGAPDDGSSPTASQPDGAAPSAPPATSSGTAPVDGERSGDAAGGAQGTP
jgi:hypothetical protein